MIVDTGLLRSGASQSHKAGGHADDGANHRTRTSPVWRGCSATSRPRTSSTRPIAARSSRFTGDGVADRLPAGDAGQPLVGPVGKHRIA
jgi:Protein of unknown function (DUF2563)